MAYILGQILAIVFTFFIIYLISKIGTKRRIGQKWSFFFLLFFPVIIVGLPIILLSPKDENRKKIFDKKRHYMVIGTILTFLFIFLFAFYNASIMMKEIKFNPIIFFSLFAVSGFGYYLTELAEGKSFAKKG